MIDDRPAVPLSPPTSPHMSDGGGKLDEYQWQHAQDAVLPPLTTIQLPPSQEVTAIDSLAVQALALPTPTGSVTQQQRPSLRSHKSFPYSLGPSSRATTSDGVIQVQDAGDTLGQFRERVVSQGPQPTGNSTLPQPTFGGSAPTSPNRLTPNSPSQDQQDALMDDDDLEMDLMEQDEEAERVPKTAAELRAQKRKMKRFRLTHNQTRFLMSEFARQAHPDAAHRERLSREIPGLSPRQVQVWFQNRRAKLKRLTTDDRESMMRSRALPAGFDMSQALHAPFGGTTTSMTASSMSPQTFGAFGGTTPPVPLTLDTFRRSSQYQPTQQQFVSPTGVTPALGTFAFTPPQSATETMSPASAIGNASAFNFNDTSRRYGYGLSSGPQPAYTNHAAHVPRLHTHDRLQRSSTEAVGSPLRASISYSGLNAGARPQSYGERSNSFSEQTSYTHERARQSRSTTNSSLASAGPYGLGFSYAQMPTYSTTAQHTQPQHSPSINAPTANTPSTLDQFRRNSTQLTGTPVASYPQYAAPSYAATTQIPQYSYWSTPYGTQSSYQQHPHRDSLAQTVTQQQPQHMYQSMGSQHHFGGVLGSPGQEQGPGDNSDGGVPVSLPY